MNDLSVADMVVVFAVALVLLRLSLWAARVADASEAAADSARATLAGTRCDDPHRDDLAAAVGALRVWTTPYATPAEAEEAARRVALSRMRFGGSS